MIHSLKDQVVVITGASAGIGAGLAQEVARRGAKPVLAARRLEQLQAVARLAGAEAECVVTDVTRREDVLRLRDAALQRFGRIDVWINNAGRGITKPFEQLGDEDLDAMIRDNVKAALYGMQAVLPHFKDRREGALINVSSMLARAPLATIRSAYSASKAALTSLTESLRLELAHDFPRLYVGTAFPGVVYTDFGNNALHGGPDSRAIPGGQTVEEVCLAIADGIEARRADIYTRPEALESVIGYLRGLASA
ncbi:MAG: SDR family NAD(P)-dependent oxidoreductase [Myxococcota bacterium]|nr:SDR family NAD(P)-dependent oxidoreductase [Myxococcota bacterium]